MLLSWRSYDRTQHQQTNPKRLNRTPKKSRKSENPKTKKTKMDETQGGRVLVENYW